MSLEQPPARVFVDRTRVILVDDVTAVGHAVLFSSPAVLDRNVEQVYVRIKRKLVMRRSYQAGPYGANAWEERGGKRGEISARDFSNQGQ